MLKPLAKLKPTWWGILYGFLRPGTEHTKSLNYMTQTNKETKRDWRNQKKKNVIII